MVIENYRPGVTERLGIYYASLAGPKPGADLRVDQGVRLPRAEGAEAGTEVIVEAETGLMAMMGTPDGPPVRFAVAMVDIATGMALVGGVLAAAARAHTHAARPATRVPAVRDGVQLPGDRDRVRERRPLEPGRALGERPPVDRPVLGVRGQPTGSSSSAPSTS